MTIVTQNPRAESVQEVCDQLVAAAKYIDKQRIGSTDDCTPSPLSALCTANEVAVVIEAGPEAESFVNANGSDRTKSSGAVECFRTWRWTGRFPPFGAVHRQRGRSCD